MSTFVIPAAGLKRIVANINKFYVATRTNADRRLIYLSPQKQVAEGWAWEPSIRYSQPLHIKSDIDTTVSVQVKVLQEFLKNINGNVDICFTRVSDTAYTITHGAFKTLGQVASPVPDKGFGKTVPEGHIDIGITNTCLEFLLGSTDYAMYAGTDRDYLQGAFIHVVNEDGNVYLRAVATDGHRMAIRNIPAPAELPENFQWFIPYGLVKALRFAYNTHSSDNVGMLMPIRYQTDPLTNIVRFDLSNNSMLVSMFWSAPEFSPFPAYQRVLDRGGGSIKLERAPLLDAINAMAASCPRRGSVIKFTTYRKDQEFRLTVELHESKGAVTYSGVYDSVVIPEDPDNFCEVSWGLDPHYVKELLNKLSQPNIIMKGFHTDKEAIEFFDSETDYSRHVIMTCRLT